MQIIFSGLLGSLSSFESFENRDPLKPVLGGVAGVARLMTGHDRLNKSEVAIFISEMWTFL